MTTNHDALRDALEIADMLRYGINNSHDYTEETIRAENFLRALAASKPEPQAQAAEPEVVYANIQPSFKPRDRIVFLASEKEEADRYNEQCYDLTQLITLQSHREAISKLHSDYLIKLHAKDLEADEKDAALKACVEALEKSIAIAEGESEAAADEALNRHNAAIAQAQEARK